jgi:micrococcal nuclease
MIAGVLVGLLSAQPTHAAADIYTWTDAAGQRHFSDSEALVPPEHRDSVGIRPGTVPSPAPIPPLGSAVSPGGAPSKTSSRRKAPREGSAAVVAVLDGDTILIDGGEKVRYVGVNAPESRHPEKLPEYCGREAFEMNRRLVAGKTVRLEFDRRRRDRYGRLLAYVYVNHLFVNGELVRLGYAQVSTYRENQRYYRELLRLQQEAIAARRGLWGGCTEIRLPQEPARPKHGIADKARRHGPS